MSRSKVIPIRRRSRQNTVEDLYRLHWREICARLRRVFGSGPPDPEDLAQEAFARFTQVEDYGSISHPKAFLFRTALNLGFNSVRRLSTARRHIEEALRSVGEPLTAEFSAEDVYSAKERLELLVEAAEGLSEKQRTILARSRIHGETYAQIAASTGWSQADISRQLNLALSIIQRKLRDAESENPNE